MPYILAFDQSQNRTGWAMYQPHKFQAMLTGSFNSAPDEDMKLLEKVGKFSDHVEELLTKWRPDLVVWEQALEIIVQHRPGKNAQKPKDDLGGERPAWGNAPLRVSADQLVLQTIQGALLASVRQRKLPYIWVHHKTWRAAILKDGNADRDRAKAKAVAICQMLRIPHNNHDEAEAACLAMWGATTDLYKSIERGLQNKTTAA